MSFIKEYLFVLPEYWVEDKLSSLRKVKWKNERAVAKKAYVPTDVEHVANVITHGIWIPFSLYGTYLLVDKSKTKVQVCAAFVYGLSLLLLFTISTCFHSVHYSGHSKLKDWLHRGDRAMIYIFIAASYFPWLILRPLPDSGWVPHLWWFIWVMAFLGIVYQQVFHEKYRTVETCVYLMVALGPSAFVLRNHTEASCEKIKLGGILYSIGVIFFKADGRVPFAHAIWHLFVVSAAYVHFCAVYEDLYS